ncbi:MAG: hypothetical protein SPJ34_09400 [Candidatus Ornithospirochaeta sp.]|nr:hypothetical protein [Candidatus Ornithospirochaeta sp.]
MKQLVLLVILIVFGVFVFFAAFRGVIYWPLLPLLAALVALYYVFSSVVTEKMIRKTGAEGSLFSFPASMIVKEGTELEPGRLCVMHGDIVFYRRRSAFGKIAVSWSCLSGQIDSYTLGKVDEYHDGILLVLKGGEEARFTSKRIGKMEEELRHALGWD